MALEHEFYLVPHTVDIRHFWMERKNHPSVIDSVVIPDDFILYIIDTLNWVPSKNPASRATAPGKGLNYYGVTLFDAESAPALKGICTAWRDLFQYAPKMIELTGDFVMADGTEQEGHYEKLVFNREEIIHCLDKMIAYSNRLVEGDLYVYHCGI